MKKVLVSAIAILMIAGAANATLIGLQWADNAGQSSAATAPNTPVTAQFYMTNGATGANPTFGGIGLIINAWADAAATIPVDSTLFQVGVSTPIPGWSVAGANQNADLNGLQFAAVAGPNYTPAKGKEVLMDISIQYTGNPAPGTQYYLTIKRDLSPTGTTSVIVDPTGADYVNNDAIWDARPGYADAYGAAYWAFGEWGNPGWSRFVKKDQVGQLGANPLVLLTPEPSSLALLVLGGFAALRRR